MEIGCFHCDKRKTTAEDCIVCAGKSLLPVKRYQILIDFALDELWQSKNCTDFPWVLPGIYRHSSGNCFIRDAEGIVWSFEELNARNRGSILVDALFPIYSLFCNASQLFQRFYCFATLRG